MGCTSAKANKVESDLERYHQEIFGVVQTGDVKRLKDILDELDRRKASTTKKENIIIFGISITLFYQFYLFSDEHFILPIFTTSTSTSSFTLPIKLMTNSSTRWTKQVMEDQIPFRNDYPRPHLRRKLWLNLNGYWSFTITSIKEIYPKNFDQIIRVPFPVESYLSGIQKRVDSKMYLWYKRNFQIKSRSWYEDSHLQYRLILHFDKVDYETVVYLNRHIVGVKHLGGYEPFSYDISSYFIKYKDNELIVRVWDPSNHWYQPRGKQLLDIKESNSIYYTPCSGIWGTVWLERVPYIHINRLQFQTKISLTDVYLKYRIDLKTATTTVFDNRSPNENIPIYSEKNFTQENKYLLDVEQNNELNENIANYEKLDFKLKISIRQKNNTKLINFISYKPNIEQEISFALNQINLWSPENPYLYQIRIDLYRMDIFVERIDSYIGFRQISLCSKKKKICLNNKPYFMSGVLDQGYWPDGLYRAPTDEAYRYDIEQIKNLGFNTIRKHMKIETSRFYYWCDVLGILVWQDMPAGDSYDGYEIELEDDKILRLHRDNTTNDLPLAQRIYEDLSQNRLILPIKTFQAKIQFEYELKAMIDFLSFHPSIIIWVLFNEGWGQYDTIRLTKWLQSYDKNRLINSASGWQDRINLGHMRDIHDYTKKIFLPSFDDENRALVLGECGGFGLMKSGWSYNSYSDNYLLTYIFEQLIINLSSRLSAMIYTQLSDIENETNGILTYNREEIKFLTPHIKRVLNNDYSRLYKLKYIWNLTSIPYTNYINLSLSKSFDLIIDIDSTYNHHFYFYICYLYSYVKITIDHYYTIILNQAHEIRDYHYISLPSNLFRGYREADGLTALSIAAGKKYKSITETLATCSEVDVNKASLSGITPLLMVAEVGWPDILDILLQRGALVDSAPSGKRAEDNKIAGSTPLIGATKYNHPECVKRLLTYHANPNHQNQSGISALMLAAEQGYFECVKLLVQAGADLELAPSGPLALTMNLCGQTPLFCAAKEGRTDIVKYLLDRGANPRVQNHYGVSTLWIPSQKGMLQVVELLLDAGAETHIAPFGNLADELNITGWTPLYAAMKSRKFDVVKLLLKRGADSNAVTKLGSTPFLLASEICDLDVIEACVEADADLDFAPSGPDADNLNITGQTALFMATLKDRVDVVKFLIEKRAQVNVQNRYGVSPLLLCAESGNQELVQALIEAGANVNIAPQGELAEENFLAGQTPLFGAAKKGHVEICEYLIKNGADINAITMTGATPLYTATEEGHLDAVILLIRHGADVNQSPKGQIARDLHIENQTPLLIACMRNHEGIIRYLIESGANVNVTSERGSSPFLAICQHNNVELARLLIRHGARHDVEAKNLYDGKINGLIVAAESGSFDILRLLVDAGLDVNYKIAGKGETAGRTPLFCACAKGFQNIVEYLVDRGADVNGTENSGLSCLHIAAAMGHADTVRILCERGANVDQQFCFEEQDVTAYDLAESQQHDHVCQVLKNFGARQLLHNTYSSHLDGIK
ncbi:unnamed protein product [Rotaria sordida]|uniref:Beta-galactosidase n=1 Tax=Rotaria sordida TaxID=392033 RepID=A0A818TD26_9BILA|nr:unnamed protein product [Rotaria sordida]